MNHPEMVLFALALVVGLVLAGRRQASRSDARVHIQVGTSLFGGIRTACGRTLRPGEGVEYGAAMCPTCVRRVGRIHDRRWLGR